MTKFIPFLVLGFLMCAQGVSADNIKLLNGNVLHGNIIAKDAEAFTITVAIVDLESQTLIGGTITVSGNSVKWIEQNNDYIDYKKPEVSESARERSRYEAVQRRKDLIKYELEHKLKPKRDAIQKEKDRVVRTRQEEIRADKFKHEKEILNLKHQNRKELISSSKREYVQPHVSVVDTNLNTAPTTNVIQGTEEHRYYE